jgi:serine protease Do
MTLHKTIVAVVLLALTFYAAHAQEKPRGWMGVLLGEPDRAAADQAGSPPDEGVRIVRLIRDAPAAQAGLRAGDVSLKVNGLSVDSVQGLIATVGGLEPGSWVEFTIDRRGREREVRARMDTRPAQIRGLDTVEGWIGIDSIDLPAALRLHFGAEEDAGVMISEVVEGGPGHVAGIELGDVVFSVDGRQVRSSGGLQALIRGGGVENVLEISLMRSGVEIVVEATVAEEPPPQD